MSKKAKKQNLINVASLKQNTTAFVKQMLDDLAFDLTESQFKELEQANKEALYNHREKCSNTLGVDYVVVVKMFGYMRKLEKRSLKSLSEYFNYKLKVATKKKYANNKWKSPNVVRQEMAEALVCQYYIDNKIGQYML